MYEFFWNNFVCFNVCVCVCVCVCKCARTCQDSVVGIATRYGLEGPRIESRC